MGEPPIKSFFVLVSDKRETGINRVTAHALDFDIVCEAANEDTALEKLRLAVTGYLEHGLREGLEQDILFPAPQKFWDKLQHAEMKGTFRLVISPNTLPLYHTVLNEHRQCAFSA